MNEPESEPEPGEVPIMAFDHEKLDVYGLAVEFVVRTNELIEQLPRGRGYLADQLQRAALSIVLNIAEGAGKYSGDDKAAFYARARGSATESAAVLDVCAKLSLVSDDVHRDDKGILERIAQMLTRLIRVHQRAREASGSGAGSGAFTEVRRGRNA